MPRPRRDGANEVQGQERAMIRCAQAGDSVRLS